MTNKTITMPLTEYEKLEDDVKFWKRLFNEIKAEKQEVIDAKAIFVTYRESHSYLGGQSHSWHNVTICGTALEKNKAVRELKESVDKAYNAYEERERIFEERLMKLRDKHITQFEVVEDELKQIKSKWWYKLFNYGK